MKHSGTDFNMSRKLDSPIVEQKIFEKFEKGLMGKALKKDAQLVTKYITELSEADKLEMKNKLESNGNVSINVDGKNLEVLNT
jgi:glycyl-tRNA synthetase (class II)